jgi:hypothetical protein
VALEQQHHLSVEKVRTQYFLELLLLVVVVENLEVAEHLKTLMVALVVAVMERAQYLATLLLEMVIPHRLHHHKVAMVEQAHKLLE